MRNWMSQRLRLAVVAAAGALLLTLGTPAGKAAAFELRSGEVVTVPAGTTLADDLLAGAQTITIAGTVEGDVFAMGSTVTVTGTINGDLIAAGQQVTIDGTVRGDVRAAGQQVTINGPVGGSATVGGQQVLLGRQGALGGGLLAGGQEVNLLGSVERGVMAGAATLHLGGAVGGNVDARVERLNVDPAARVGGQLRYTSATQAVVPAGVVAGGVDYRPSERLEQRRAERRGGPFEGVFGFFGLVWLVGSIIAGVLLVHFLPRFASSTAAQVRHHPLSSFGIGLLVLFLVPVVALLVAITLIGLPLSLLAVAAYLVALYLGQLLLGLAIGAGLVEAVRRRGDPTRTIRLEWLVILGLVVLYIATHLPWIGGLATFVALCIGTGAVVRQLSDYWRARPVAAAAT
ncbi:MAG: polymer-forming cytoskeletal protein [Chloroflexi bacterium]|nr:polymer-forming cytoskeletal protein [Chloroflexota bacterium]